MAKLIYARGCPERVSLKETYTYKLELSQNRVIGISTAPVGQLEILVPYDGRHYFTREACADVEAQLNGINPDDGAEAQVGHVLLANYDKTDLKDVLDLGEHYDTVAIRVPVVSDSINKPEQLYSDQEAALIVHEYRPRAPDVTPITVRLDITDEDSFTQLFRAVKEKSLTDWAELKKQLAQQINFNHWLVLHLQVSLAIPSSMPESIAPRIARVSLDWPTMTSFRTFNLKVDVAEGEKPPALRYNPVKACIEWEDVKLAPIEAPSSTNGNEQAMMAPKARRFSSRATRLLVNHPGEFYQRLLLKGAIELEIKDFLLSGVEMRVFDGSGLHVDAKRCANERITRIIIEVEQVLDDAFAQRKFFPYQQRVFEEVIPDQIRLADIRGALLDYGFQINKELPIADTPEVLRHVLQAERAEEQYTMELLVLVDGEHYIAERQTELPGGQIYASRVTSGELTVHMLGTMTGSTKELIRRMNAIQNALYERFARLRAKR